MLKPLLTLGAIAGTFALIVSNEVQDGRPEMLIGQPNTGILNGGLALLALTFAKNDDRQAAARACERYRIWRFWNSNFCQVASTYHVAPAPSTLIGLAPEYRAILDKPKAQLTTPFYRPDGRGTGHDPGVIKQPSKKLVKR